MLDSESATNGEQTLLQDLTETHLKDTMSQEVGSIRRRMNRSMVHLAFDGSKSIDPFTQMFLLLSEGFIRSAVLCDGWICWPTSVNYDHR